MQRKGLDPQYIDEFLHELKFTAAHNGCACRALCHLCCLLLAACRISLHTLSSYNLCLHLQVLVSSINLMHAILTRELANGVGHSCMH